MADADITELATALQSLGISAGDSTFIRRAKVLSVGTTTASISLGGVTVNNVPFYANVKVTAGQSVDVLFDGPSPRILGPLGAYSGGGSLIAWAKVDSTSGGSSTGFRGLGTGAGLQTIGMTATLQATALGVASVPVVPGNLLRIQFKFAAFGPADLSREWYFMSRISENGGAYYDHTEFRLAPSGVNAPSPLGETLYVVPPGVTSISAAIDARINTGTGSLFRYSSGVNPFASHFTLEDLGPSNPVALPVPAVTPTTAMVKLAETVLNADSATLSITIPTDADYRQLEVRFNIWANNAATVTSLRLRFNGDATNTYQGQELYGSGAVAGARYGVAPQIIIGDISTINAQSTGGTIVIDGALDAAKFSFIRGNTGGVHQGTGMVEHLVVGMWTKTDKVTTINLINAGGHLWGANSWVKLYGVN